MQLPVFVCYASVAFLRAVAYRLRSLALKSSPATLRRDSESAGTATPAPAPVPPTSRAGPRLRAGFTLTPVMWMPKIWIATSVMPMASPANPAGAAFCVDPRITMTKISVATNSKTIAEVRLYPPWYPAPHPF